EVHKASLGWFWPVDLQDVVVRDEQGNTLAEIPQISSRKTLLALIWHPSDLGEWKIQQPTVHVVCERNTTNWETALAPWLEGESSRRQIALHLGVHKGTIHVEDAETKRQWKLDNAEGTVRLKRAAGSPLEIQVEGARLDASQAGHLAADLSATIPGGGR